MQIVFSDVPCNWLQCQENCIDPVHFEWLHSNWSRALNGDGKPRADAPQDRLRRVRVRLRLPPRHGAARPRTTSCGRSAATCLWPNCLFTGDHFEWRVPIDDDNTLSVGWFFNAVPPGDAPFEQERIPYWYSPIKDEKTGRWITRHVMNQDFIAWVGQGDDRGPLDTSTWARATAASS